MFEVFIAIILMLCAVAVLALVGLAIFIEYMDWKERR
jgi:hypothetical protein